MVLHQIYAGQSPEFIQELLEAAELRRLRGVGMHCGCDYTQFPTYRISDCAFNYTRYLHSVGTALILWHFTKDIRQSIAGLLHDIATPAFAHVVDFMNHDHLIQESTERATQEIIDHSDTIRKVLNKYNLNSYDVANYHLYPLADNPIPRLCADRLEYTLGNFLNARGISAEEIEWMYKALEIGQNEAGQPEFVFTDPDAAQCFALVALQNSYWYTTDEDRFSMQYLADLLSFAQRRQMLSIEDLMQTEQDVIARLMRYPETAEKWEQFTALNRVTRTKAPLKDRYCIHVAAKKRYIDPLVKQGNRIIRATAVFPEVREAIGEFMKSDFNIWLSAGNLS